MEKRYFAMHKLNILNETNIHKILFSDPPLLDNFDKKIISYTHNDIYLILFYSQKKN